MRATYFHGTTADVVARIRREGLRPELDRAYNFISSNQILANLLGRVSYEEMTHSNGRTRDGYIFLTAELDAAKSFAEFRVMYESLPANSWARYGDAHLLKQANEFVRKGKLPRPVVLQLGLTREIEEQLIPDNRADGDLFGFSFKGTLPPDALTRIIRLPSFFEDRTHDQQKEPKKAA